MCATHQSCFLNDTFCLFPSCRLWFNQQAEVLIWALVTYESMRRWQHVASEARGMKLLEPTWAIHGHFLAVFADSSLPLFGGKSQWVRGREARQGWLLRNFCCTTRLVMHAPLLGPAPRGVCEREMGRDGAHRVVCTAARRWARGLLLIVQLSLLIMSLSNQCKRRQEPKWHFSTLITRVSFVAPPSFTFTRLQSLDWIFHLASSYGWIHLGAVHKSGLGGGGDMCGQKSRDKDAASLDFFY